MNTTEQQFLQNVLRNVQPAVAFCEALGRISQTLDDIVDGDTRVSAGDVIRSYWEALIELPENPFYRQNETYLRPLLASALQDWTDSTVLERTGQQHDATLAFVMRDQLAGVVVQCARLVGGYDWMREVGPVIRQYFHDERLHGYLSGLGLADAETDGSDPSEPATVACQESNQ
ncbi:hypothetical protein [Salinicola sp. DM10]|uniref:hypothetical protein n=1 Tax=Salinicola sp. DM10 TaxID=2815721 RepID=UPI001A8C3908|nr:hypothetical protein [Salinicola sp. DM10]MCE3025719.1 hypothetical protein [Salinicola sp. DM10]